ncbi:hypothetical protein HY968_04390 [Candidatus Kaiserbacteria bacterium]|nr:hypothetical protein [Candidatus Kaiserbacteria bacterium]
MKKAIKVFSVVLIIIATSWLVLGVWMLFSSEIGRALFIEIFLPILGAMVSLWITVYAISIRSWKFFWLYSGILMIIWTGLWLLFD